MHLTFYFFAIVDGWWKRIKSHSLHAGSPKTLGLVHSLACKTCWNMAGNIPFWQSFSSFSNAFFQVKILASMLTIKLCSPSLQDIRQKLEESLHGTAGGPTWPAGCQNIVRCPILLVLTSELEQLRFARQYMIDWNRSNTALQKSRRQREKW